MAHNEHNAVRLAGPFPSPAKPLCAPPPRSLAAAAAEAEHRTITSPSHSASHAAGTPISIGAMSLDTSRMRRGSPLRCSRRKGHAGGHPEANGMSPFSPPRRLRRTKQDFANGEEISFFFCFYNEFVKNLYNY